MSREKVLNLLKKDYKTNYFNFKVELQGEGLEFCFKYMDWNTVKNLIMEVLPENLNENFDEYDLIIDILTNSVDKFDYPALKQVRLADTKELLFQNEKEIEEVLQGNNYNFISSITFSFVEMLAEVLQEIFNGLSKKNNM